MDEADTEDWGKPLSPERHHYWPECVSEFWKDTEGHVIRLAWDETELWRPPKNFGVIKDGHRIKSPPPWDTSIEHIFGKADSNFPAIISWLQKISPRPSLPDDPLKYRLCGEFCSDDQHALLGECIASLVVRSPAFRSRLHDETVELRKLVKSGGMPFRDKQDALNLIVCNMATQYRGILESLKSRSTKFVVLTSPDSEFVFGEGFLNNLDGLSIGNNTRCLVPVTPRIAIMIYQFSFSYSIDRIYSIELSPEETDVVNCVAQIYTKDYLYFRFRKPFIFDYFTRRQFLEVPNHRVSFLEDIGDVIRRKFE